MQKPTCAANTSRGYRCINPAKNGPWCPAHDPGNFCGKPKANGQACRRKAGPGHTACALHGGAR